MAARICLKKKGSYFMNVSVTFIRETYFISFVNNNDTFWK